ncbi:hypothetical protein TcasGA2_TC003065 [Tribolium castaneum]|uniref:Uncharacterized protein n=1 Tax=Tribolium castaneum TaxID=7070 RepID=A0A139WLR8_TRICA|nr:hypothetical protein TcasGA2_TC003065 [Tribolium castaneum]
MQSDAECGRNAKSCAKNAKNIFFATGKVQIKTNFHGENGTKDARRRVRSLSSIDQPSSGGLDGDRGPKLGHQAHTRARLSALAYMIGDNPEFERTMKVARLARFGQKGAKLEEWARIVFFGTNSYLITALGPELQRRIRDSLYCGAAVINAVYLIFIRVLSPQSRTLSEGAKAQAPEAENS